MIKHERMKPIIETCGQFAEAGYIHTVTDDLPYFRMARVRERFEQKLARRLNDLESTTISLNHGIGITPSLSDSEVAEVYERLWGVREPKGVVAPMEWDLFYTVLLEEFPQPEPPRRRSSF